MAAVNDKQEISYRIMDTLHGVASLTSQIVLPAIPAILQTGAAGATFAAGIIGAQYTGFACGFSCASPLKAPLAGALAVAASSAAAGQVASMVRRFQEGENAWPKGGLALQEMALHALLGVVAFKAMGGSFRSLMPSDLKHPGALARTSIPAKSERYGNEAELAEISALFKRHGCHHCGCKQGKPIADHMPPNKDVWGEGWASKSRKDLVPLSTSSKPPSSPSWLRNLLRWPRPGGTTTVVPRQYVTETTPPRAQGTKMGGAAKQAALRGTKGAGKRSFTAGTPPRQQRFYPQCLGCSQLQAQAVRLNRTKLVIHHASGFPEPFWYTGVWVGCLPSLVLPAKKSSSQVSGQASSRRRQRGSRHGPWTPVSHSSDSKDLHGVKWAAQVNPSQEVAHVKRTMLARWPNLIDELQDELVGLRQEETKVSTLGGIFALAGTQSF